MIDVFVYVGNISWIIGMYVFCRHACLRRRILVVRRVCTVFIRYESILQDPRKNILVLGWNGITMYCYFVNVCININEDSIIFCVLVVASYDTLGLGWGGIFLDF